MRSLTLLGTGVVVFDCICIWLYFAFEKQLVLEERMRSLTSLSTGVFVFDCIWLYLYVTVFAFVFDCVFICILKAACFRRTHEVMDIAGQCQDTPGRAFLTTEVWSRHCHDDQCEPIWFEINLCLLFGTFFCIWNYNWTRSLGALLALTSSWSPWGLLTLSFVPQGCSGRVTHAVVIG